MKQSILLCWHIAILFLFLNPAHADSFIKIDAPIEYDVLINDEIKHIQPRCSLFEYTHEPYSFYIKPGKKDKFLIFLNGGGACWNGSTCNPTSQLYVPTLSINNDPNQMDGLFNLTTDENPYKDWSIIFLPYCTGDIFLSSKETTYINPNPNESFPFPIFTIHHHGFDNFLYVMDYINQNLVDSELPISKVMVAGSSAGSYGASLNYPWVKKLLEIDQIDHGKTFLINDGGIGVLTDTILHDAFFGQYSSWNIDANLHPSLSYIAGAQEGNTLMFEIFELLSFHYPKDKFAQYTTAYDAVQTLFLNVMNNQDEPEQWFSDLDFIGWRTEMDIISGGLSDVLTNYRRYIEPGCNHSILRSAELYTSFMQNEEISFLSWMTGMTGGNDVDMNNWKNLSCTPYPDGNCGEANLTPEGINACIARSAPQI